MYYLLLYHNVRVKPSISAYYNYFDDYITYQNTHGVAHVWTRYKCSHGCYIPSSTTNRYLNLEFNQEEILVFVYRHGYLHLLLGLCNHYCILSLMTQHLYQGTAIVKSGYHTYLSWTHFTNETLRLNFGYLSYGRVGCNINEKSY